MSCPFEMGDEHAVGRGKEKSETGEEEGGASSLGWREKDYASWPGGRPPKGKIAWVDDERIVIIGAGRDARWELFTLGIDQYGKRGVGRLGWKRYLEDEGLD